MQITMDMDAKSKTVADALAKAGYKSELKMQLLGAGYDILLRWTRTVTMPAGEAACCVWLQRNGELGTDVRLPGTVILREGASVLDGPAALAEINHLLAAAIAEKAAA